MLTRLQIIVCAAFATLFLILYFGCPTTPKKQRLLEKSRAEQLESTHIYVLIREAKEHMVESQQSYFRVLEHAVDDATDDSSRVEALEKLSGAWFRENEGAIAGYFAEEIAQVKKDEVSWSIAGTTYALGLKMSEKAKIRDFCAKRAIRAFEHALSIDPDNVDHKINRAVVLAEHPPADEPMKGIQQLLQLNAQHPDNVAVLDQLARFGMQTGQFEKAIGRLQKALAIDPNRIQTICLLAQAHKSAGNPSAAELYAAKCDSLQLVTKEK